MAIEKTTDKSFEREYNNALSKFRSYLEIYAANVPVGPSTGPYAARGYFARLKDCSDQLIAQYKNVLRLAEREGIPNPQKQVLHNFRIFLERLDPEITNSSMFKTGLKKILEDVDEENGTLL